MMSSISCWSVISRSFLPHETHPFCVSSAPQRGRVKVKVLPRPGVLSAADGAAVGLHDPPDHGKPQPGPLAAVGGIRLPEPPPDLVQILRRNADAVVGHHAGDGVFPGGEGEGEMPLSRPYLTPFSIRLISIRISMRLVPLQHQRPALCSACNRDAARIGRFPAAALPPWPARLAQVQLAPGSVLLWLLICPRQHQQLGNKPRPSFRPASSTAASAAFASSSVLAVGKGILALGKDDRRGGAQLVGGVGCKLLFCSQTPASSRANIRSNSAARVYISSRPSPSAMRRERSLPSLISPGASA